jgi:NAD+ diphosphatase
MNQNYFSTNFLDRVSLKRNDKDWVNTQLENESTQIIPIWDSEVFCFSESNPNPIFLSLKDIKEFKFTSESFILLGIAENKTYFAIEIQSSENASALSENKNGEFQDLKKIAPLLNFQNSALLSLARFMTNWNFTHRFCGKCGSPTKNAEAGNLRICTNEQCKLNHFPSMDPAVIVLVSSGEKCLLGRQSFWPKGMFSTIAGFVEPGESIEDAVIREVDEETGIKVENIEYQSSQPWLFPSSLMLGFNATAKNTTINYNKDEMDDVRWFSREEIKENITNGTMKPSSKDSISYRLIEAWYDKGDVGKLNKL